MTLNRGDLDTLSPTQRQRLAEALLDARHGPAARPVSAGQRALWNIHQLHPDQSTYHVSLAFRALRPLDRPALSGAFTALVARHPALRTTYALHGDAVVQHVAPPG